MLPRPLFAVTGVTDIQSALLLAVQEQADAVLILKLPSVAEAGNDLEAGKIV